MRLFIAFPVPPLKIPSFSGLVGAKWVETSDFHITLRFIGDVPRNIGFEIAQELTRLAFKPLEIKLNDYGYFGGLNPHNFHIRVENTNELKLFHNTVESLMRRLGLPPEGRKFTPHITLATLNRQCKEQDMLRFLSTVQAFRHMSYPANEFCLYSAKAGQGGGPYKIEARYAAY